MKKLLLILAGIGVLWWIFRRTAAAATPPLNVGPNPVLKQSDNVRPQSMVGTAILALSPKVLSWFSQPTLPVSQAPPTDWDFDYVAAGYYSPGTETGEEEDPL